MTEAYASMSGSAKTGGAETFTRIPDSCTISPLQMAVTEFIKAHNPRKAWLFVASAFGIGERSAKHRLAGSARYTAEELQVLLHGPNGREILDVLMETASPVPAWWTEWCKTWELTAIRRDQALLQQRALALDNTPMDRPARRKLKAFADADRNISAIRADKETAQGLRHQDVDRTADRGLVASAAKAKIPAAGMRAGGRR